MKFWKKLKTLKNDQKWSFWHPKCHFWTFLTFFKISLSSLQHPTHDIDVFSKVDIENSMFNTNLILPSWVTVAASITRMLTRCDCNSFRCLVLWRCGMHLNEGSRLKVQWRDLCTRDHARKIPVQHQTVKSESHLGCCKLENEILKKAKNAEKWHFWVSKWSFLVIFQRF